MKSKLFTLDWRDLINGLFIAFLAAILSGIIGILDNRAVVYLGNTETCSDCGDKCSIILSTKKSGYQFKKSIIYEGTCVNNCKFDEVYLAAHHSNTPFSTRINRNPHRGNAARRDVPPSLK